MSAVETTSPAGSLSLTKQRPLALFWLLAAGGAGLYLFCLDVLCDAEHGSGRGAQAGRSRRPSTR
jgi:hypothetical protein